MNDFLISEEIRLLQKYNVKTIDEVLEIQKKELAEEKSSAN